MWLAATMVAAPGMGVSSSAIVLQANRYCAASVGSPSSARVKLAAYPFQKYGMLDGMVK
jgi:hypothetical protein